MTKLEMLNRKMSELERNGDISEEEYGAYKELIDYDDEDDKAHEVSELFQELIVTMGATLLQPLTPKQREYVLFKANEFRFWRIEDELK